jgi:hypothetical protein
MFIFVSSWRSLMASNEKLVKFLANSGTQKNYEFAGHLSTALGWPEGWPNFGRPGPPAAGPAEIGPSTYELRIVRACRVSIVNN